MRKFFRGVDFGGPVTEGGSHAKKVGDHWSKRLCVYVCVVVSHPVYVGSNV